VLPIRRASGAAAPGGDAGAPAGAKADRSRAQEGYAGRVGRDSQCRGTGLANRKSMDIRHGAGSAVGMSGDEVPRAALCTRVSYGAVRQLWPIVSALAAIASCAAPDLQHRQEQLLLDMIRSRLRVIEENNQNFNEFLLADRNRYFEWIKESQVRVRAGSMPREEDMTKMINTYSSWARMAQENTKWMESQLDGLTHESDEANRSHWSDAGSIAEARELIEQASTMMRQVRAIIKLRVELATECQAEADKLASYKATIFR
jgi:hypothetical protein